MQEYAPLAKHSTMGLGGTARYLSIVSTKEEVLYTVNRAKSLGVSTIMIGEGSNIVWKDEGYSGMVIVNKIIGKNILSEDSKEVIVDIGAGENWDEVVAWTVEKKLRGIETLSLIPGTAGATPVQNVGAYGGEISKVLISLEAYDTNRQEFVTISGEDCGFGYRTSIFKTSDKGRYYITSIRLVLSKGRPVGPYYESVQKYFDNHYIEDIDVNALRLAVIDIRNGKLPDPKLIPNNGSFFANPIISNLQFNQLKLKYPDIKAWSAGADLTKVSGAWLIEQCGMRGIHDEQTGMSTWPGQALVLINEKAKSTADLLTFKQKIVDAVNAKFGINLVQEPELLP
mgnify:CR=1 FL=1